MISLSGSWSNWTWRRKNSVYSFDLAQNQKNRAGLFKNETSSNCAPQPATLHCISKSN